MSKSSRPANRALAKIFKASLDASKRTGDKISIHHSVKTKTLHIFGGKLDYWIDLDAPDADKNIRDALRFMEKLGRMVAA